MPDGTSHYNAQYTRTFVHHSIIVCLRPILGEREKWSNTVMTAQDCSAKSLCVLLIVRFDDGLDPTVCTTTCIWKENSISSPPLYENGHLLNISPTHLPRVSASLVRSSCAVGGFASTTLPKTLSTGGGENGAKSASIDKSEGPVNRRTVWCNTQLFSPTYIKVVRERGEQGIWNCKTRLVSYLA